MYPVLRLIGVSLTAKRAPKQSWDSVGECRFRAHPTDIDMFAEMNNGRHLTLYDIGRFDLGIKIGLASVLKEKRWGLVVAGSTVRFRKRIRIFDSVVMRTQLVGRDERWFYLEQAMIVRGEACSSALMRTAVTERGRVVQTERVVEAMGLAEANPQLPQWVVEWAEADKGRPWPPDVAG
ncbi:MAG: acyl-CoA thioesterase [Pseudomonadota bacterium]